MFFAKLLTNRNKRVHTESRLDSRIKEILRLSYKGGGLNWASLGEGNYGMKEEQSTKNKKVGVIKIF